MKKIVSLILAGMLLLLCCAATAEGFSPRNGIQFGDSMDDVLAKETLAIENTYDAAAAGDEAEYPYTMTTVNDTIAGVADSYVLYEFDADKTLREIVYVLGGDKSKEEAETEYELLYNDLTSQCGTALGYTDGRCYIINCDALNTAVWLTSMYTSMGLVGDVRDYDEWVVDTDAYHVKVELVRYCCGSSEVTYTNRVSFTCFTDADLQAARDAKSAK